MTTAMDASGVAGPAGRVASIAVVFVATDERYTLLAAIESLFASRPGSPLEVVVVDNASEDGSGGEVKRRWPEVQVLRNERRRGLNANLNAGMAATSAPFVMTCNCDIGFHPGAVDLLAAFLDAHPCAGIAAPQLVFPSGERQPCARRWYTVRSLLALRWPWVRDEMAYPSVRASRYADWDYARPRSVEWVHGTAPMLRRAAIEEVGPLDEGYRVYWGDLDLCMRLHEAGWEVWCVPKAVVTHVWQRASSRGLSRAWWSHLAALLRLLWIYRGLRPRVRTPAVRDPGCSQAQR